MSTVKMILVVLSVVLVLSVGNANAWFCGFETSEGYSATGGYAGTAMIEAQSGINPTWVGYTWGGIMQDTDVYAGQYSARFNAVEGEYGHIATNNGMNLGKQLVASEFSYAFKTDFSGTNYGMSLLGTSADGPITAAKVFAAWFYSNNTAANYNGIGTIEVGGSDTARGTVIGTYTDNVWHTMKIVNEIVEVEEWLDVEGNVQTTATTGVQKFYLDGVYLATVNTGADNKAIQGLAVGSGWRFCNNKLGQQLCNDGRLWVDDIAIVVPEPTTMMILATGALLALKRKNAKK
jgi:hypothetical protein